MLSDVMENVSGEEGLREKTKSSALALLSFRQQSCHASWRCRTRRWWRVLE